MSNKLKLYHKALPYFLIPVSLLVIAGYGWIGYATLTHRSGHNGNLYYYYGLTRPEFYFYCFSLVMIAVIFLLFQAKCIIDNNPKRFVNIFWMFISFVLVITLCEIYLSIRFVGKG